MSAGGPSPQPPPARGEGEPERRPAICPVGRMSGSPSHEGRGLGGEGWRRDSYRIAIRAMPSRREALCPSLVMGMVLSRHYSETFFRQAV